MSIVDVAVGDLVTFMSTKMMMILLLFLQKQNLAFDVYQFGSVLYTLRGCKLCLRESVVYWYSI